RDAHRHVLARIPPGRPASAQDRWPPERRRPGAHHPMTSGHSIQHGERGSSMNAIRTAAVIGGGIAGPVAALALRKAGIDATVYEAYQDTADGVGGTLMVAPNGLAALRIVGIDVDAVGRPIQGMVMTDGRGKRIGEFGGIPGLP